MEASREFHHEYTVEVTCPGCGHEMRDSWELSDEGERTCDECGCEFVWSRHVDVTYSTKQRLSAPSAPQACAAARLALRPTLDVPTPVVTIDGHPCDDFGPRPGARCLGCGHGRGCPIGRAADLIIAQVAQAAKAGAA